MNRLTLRMNRKGKFMADIPLAGQGKHYTVAIGLGGTGIRCLKSLRRQIQDNIRPDGTKEQPYSRVSLLAIDTDRSLFESLDKDSLINTLRLPDRMPEASGSENFDFLITNLYDRLRNQLQNARFQNRDIWVHVFAGFGGATGGRLLIPLCDSLRKLSHFVDNQVRPIVSVYCFLPYHYFTEGYIPDDFMVRNRILSNCVRAMGELDARMTSVAGPDNACKRNDDASIVSEYPADMCFLISAANKEMIEKQGSTSYTDKTASFVLQTIDSLTEDTFETIRREIISQNDNTACISADGKREYLYPLTLASFEDPCTMLASRLGGEFYRRILTRLTDMDASNELTNILGSDKNDLSEQILKNISLYPYFDGTRRRLWELDPKEWSSFLCSAKVGNDGLDLNPRILPEYYAAVAAAEQAMNKNVTALTESWKRNINEGYSRRLKEWMLKTAVTSGRDTSLHEKISYDTVENRILNWMNDAQADCIIKEREISSRVKGIASELQELQSGHLLFGRWGRKNDLAADLIRQAASERINLSGLRKYRKFLTFLEGEIRDMRDDLQKVGQMAGVLTSVTENIQDADEHGKISASLLRMYEPILEKMDEEKELDFFMNVFFDSMESKDLFQTDHFFDFASEYACRRLNYLSSRTKVSERQLREQAWSRYEQDILRLAAENTVNPSFPFSKEGDKARNARFALITVPDSGSPDAGVEEKINNISATAAEISFCMPSDLKRLQMIRVFDGISFQDSAMGIVSQKDHINTENKTEISFICGDITRQAAECIVNPTNISLTSKNKGTVDSSVRLAAGPGLAEECSKVKFYRGQALVTGGYELPAKYIIHVVGPNSLEKNGLQRLRECYLSVLDAARTAGLHQIVFPAIGIGGMGFKAEQAAECATGAVKDWIRNNAGYPMQVIFCLYNEETKNIFELANNKEPSERPKISPSREEMPEDLRKKDISQAVDESEKPENMTRPHSYDGCGKYIFISYAHKNDKEIHNLICRLQKDGYNVWYDEGIYVGTQYAEMIANRIEGCTIFLSMVTKEFFLSKNCLDELEYARNEKQENERFMIFLEEVDIPKAVKLQHSRIQNLHRETEGANFYYKLYQNSKIRECRDQP